MRVVITGAATGIGAETVRVLKDAGHEISALDVAEPANVDQWLKVDLSDMDAIHAACAQLDGPFDALINNAGLPPRADNQVQLLSVNVFGLRQVTRQLLPKLADGARIVNTASRAGLMWQENIEEVKALLSLQHPVELPAFVAARDIDPTRAYNLSKEAVIAYTKSLTKPLLDRDIRINSVSPAPVATEILDDFMAALGDRAAQAIALPGRAGQPDEVARVIAFLASDESSWIKGEDVLVDGGVSAMVTSSAHGLSGEV
jgi:NAD(P)-dependent dehydrogenase (short-subunit alcohol dehydrogenase family)